MPSKRNSAAGADDEEACAKESTFDFGDCASVTTWNPLKPGVWWWVGGWCCFCCCGMGVPTGGVGGGLCMGWWGAWDGGVAAFQQLQEVLADHPHPHHCETRPAALPVSTHRPASVICQWDANTKGICDPDTKKCYITYGAPDAVRHLEDTLQLFISKDAIQDFK